MKRAAIVLITLIPLVLACSIFQFASSNENGSGQQGGNVDLAGYFLPDPAVGLDGLQSYTQSLSISFSGTQDGKQTEFTDIYRQDLNRETQTKFTILDITNPEGATERIVVGNAGEAYYSILDDGECRVSWGERAEGSKNPFVPAVFLPPLLAVNENSFEEINGVQTRRYSFDAASLGYPSTMKVEGQVWLAEQGGYVVKYKMLIQDEDGFFGEGVKGEQVFEYELSQINAIAGPELPQGCLAVLTDFPSMPDAFDIQRLPGVLAYTSPSDASQIQSFYEQQLQDQGWKMGTSYSLPDGGSTLIFLQAEDPEIAYITLQKAGTETWVTVQVETMEESMPLMIP